MRLGIKGKQVLGVTSIVSGVVVILSLLHLARLASVGLEESRARAELLANAIVHRAREVVSEGDDPVHALRADSGLRAILESSLYSKNVISAAIVDVRGLTVAHADRSLEDQPLPPGNDLAALLARPALSQLWTIYSGQGRTFEFRQPLLLGGTEFGSIRIGMSTLLIRQDLDLSLRPAVAAAFAALGVSIIVATLLAQLLLRPIHVLRSGLTRLGRGEFGVRLDLDQHDEFGELGTFFNTVSQQLSADRSQMAGQMANLESAVEQLEDAVAIVNPRGEVLFANPAMRELIQVSATGAALTEILAPQHPLRRLSEQTLASRQSHGPLQATFDDRGERLVTTHPINDPQGELVGVMVTARNLQYLDQVQSTVRYSRKLAALGRLSAGVAHEVKNPLNAMMIHLELLRQQFAPVVARPSTGSGRAGVNPTRGDLVGPRAGVATVAAAPPPAAIAHVDVIASEIRRLDQVLQGFLKFTRAEDLKLQPVDVAALVQEVVPIIRPEAEQRGVVLAVECDNVPDINGDPAMLRQALLNLTLNACQAMPNGGTLRIRGERVIGTGRRVAILFSDTGTGIAPEHLQRIFDLYFTTKEKGSGIGLSMVFRTVQMHDGDIEVQSTPGVGTTFKILLPQA
jgi:signal transduction histidine kinase